MGGMSGGNAFTKTLLHPVCGSRANTSGFTQTVFVNPSRTESTLSADSPSPESISDSRSCSKIPRMCGWTGLGGSGITALSILYTLRSRFGRLEFSRVQDFLSTERWIRKIDGVVWDRIFLICNQPTDQGVAHLTNVFSLYALHTFDHTIYHCDLRSRE